MTWRYITQTIIATRRRKQISKQKEIKLTPMVAVGLKATLIFIISPLDIPPCKSKLQSHNTHEFSPTIKELENTNKPAIVRCIGDGKPKRVMLGWERWRITDKPNTCIPPERLVLVLIFPCSSVKNSSLCSLPVRKVPATVFIDSI